MPDYRETVEKLRELVVGRKVQHMEPGAFIEHDRWDSQCPFCLRDLDALLTAQADELATLRAENERLTGLVSHLITQETP